MERTITVGDQGACAEVTTSGVADKAGSLAMVEAIAETLDEAGIKRVLVDHRNITGVSGATTEVYARLHELAALRVPRDVKVAEVVRPEHRGFFDFLEPFASIAGTGSPCSMTRRTPVDGCSSHRARKSSA